MTPAAPPASARLRRAAQAERAEIKRHRDRLTATRDDLRAELARIEAGLADLEDRQRLLDRLLGATAAAGSHQPTPVQPDDVSRSSDRAQAILRGPAIRAAAVRAVAQNPGREVLHYRDWYELVLSEGVSIAGKDPLAVFLTQLNRSPLVRKTSKAGVYELDLGAPARLRARLDQLQHQLRQLTATPASTADLATIRERRRILNAEIGQVEKALEEATEVLDTGHEDRLAAAG
jgi:septal ring factor EnvC (AmiA/AmiB activator)